VPLITAIGASFFWQYIFRGLFGSAVKAFPVPTLLEGRVNVLGLDFLKVRLIVIIVSIVALIGLYLFVQKTKTGKSIRAVAEDKDVAALMGIDVDRAIATTFAIGATMAGIAAVLWGWCSSRSSFNGLRAGHQGVHRRRAESAVSRRGAGRLLLASSRPSARR
jgi:branched-chain amino acid transport system permease protein